MRKRTPMRKKAPMKKAVRRMVKKAAPRRSSLQVRSHFYKILHSISEAREIQRDEQDGITFNDFLPGFRIYPAHDLIDAAKT